MVQVKLAYYLILERFFMIIKFIQDGLEVSEVTGVQFDNITYNWQTSYNCKIISHGEIMELMSFCGFNDESDPHGLRDNLQIAVSCKKSNGKIIYHDFISFNDWKAKGFSFGSMKDGEIVEITMKFWCRWLSDAKAGKSANFDFEFSVR